VRLYAESSAVLRWLLGAPDGDTVRALLAKAEIVATSAITPAEVARTLRRLAEAGDLDRGAHDRAWLRFRSAASHWDIYAVTHSVLAQVEERFPAEPVRTLDAIHLATALEFSLTVSPLAVVSTDRRLRDNAAGLGLAVAPDELARGR
jgi:predicted nucleic acid-binding protein